MDESVGAYLMLKIQLPIHRAAEQGFHPAVPLALIS
jgi:hypothetical protein